MAQTAIWLIDEGHHGHRAQSEGVAEALKDVLGPVALTRIPCAERLRGVLRPAARALFDAAPRPLAPTLARRFSRFARPAGPKPELILSSGGRTAFASRALAIETGAPNVFVGEPGPFPARWFAVILAPAPRPGLDAIDTGFTPSTMTPARCAAAAAARWPDGPPTGVRALLVGGASRSHRWRAEDFAALGAAASRLAARDGFRWLVTTSRRTGAEGDRALAAALDPAVVAEQVLFSTAPEPVVAAYLGAAAAAYVTQDSATMLSEAIAAGRPTVAVAPPGVELPQDGPLARLFARLDATPWVSRRAVATLADPPGPPLAAASHEDAARAMAQAAERLVARLGLRR
jgi:mitochondrial fission protein ELM1